MTLKELRTGSSMLVKHFKSRAIMGHWYPIISNDCHEHAMTSMMVLRQVYALVVWPYDVRKPCQGMSLKKGDVGELERWVTAWKGMTGFLEWQCSREGKVWDILVLVISVARWNYMHIGSAPRNNEPVTVQWKEKWHRIVVLDIGCRFDFAMDFGLPGKEMNLGNTLRVEVWAYGFPCFGCMHHILLFVGLVNVHMCICGYCKYYNELCYKAPVCGIIVIWSCCHDVLLVRKSFIVNTTMSFVINFHGQYVSFSAVLLVIGVTEQWGWCSPKGEGYVTTMVKIPCNKSKWRQK